MDGDNLKLKYIMKKSIRIQMRQCRVVLYSWYKSLNNAMVFILEGSTNGIQIKLIRDNQSIATSKVELYDGNNSATGATKFYLSIDFDI